MKPFLAFGLLLLLARPGERAGPLDVRELPPFSDDESPEKGEERERRKNQFFFFR